jgi:hypothetical protein
MIAFCMKQQFFAKVALRKAAILVIALRKILLGVEIVIVVILLQ